MDSRYWWILLAVVIGALIAGGFMAVHYAKQQVPSVSVDESGLR
jgi:hypothetical protein